MPELCGNCHANAALIHKFRPQQCVDQLAQYHMAKYKIPADQFAKYRSSVHWEALDKRGDDSAPSCASCHGNHGATPPAVASVSAICGTCHAMFEELYDKSPHQPLFAAMGAAGCVTCHGNHDIARPHMGMLAGADAVCSQCHDGESAGGRAAAAAMAGAITGLDESLNRSDRMLARATPGGHGSR